MKRGKSLLVTSVVGALLALLASMVSAGEIGVCPPYSKTFGPDDPAADVIAFIHEVNARPGGGTVLLEPGTRVYGGLIPITGTVCLQQTPPGEGSSETAPVWGADIHVMGAGIVTARDLRFDAHMHIDAGGMAFLQNSPADHDLRYLENEGTAFVLISNPNYDFSAGQIVNWGRLFVTGGLHNPDEFDMPALENHGYALLDRARIFHVVNEVNGSLAITASTVAADSVCELSHPWHDPSCVTTEFYPGLENRGGYVDLNQSIVSQDTDEGLAPSACTGQITDLGYNVIATLDECILLDRKETTLEADPMLDGGMLRAGSPAIDLIPLDLCRETDALGRPRTDGNGDGIVACDAGALEFTGTGMVVKSPPFARDYGLVDLETDTALYVVLMSSAAFDPADVVVDSVILNETGAVPRGYNYVDRNGDGVLDLRLRYKLKDVPLVCGEQTLTVSATTVAGDTVAGELKLEVTGCVF